jgi:hypothetical protein
MTQLPSSSAAAKCLPKIGFLLSETLENFAAHLREIRSRLIPTFRLFDIVPLRRTKIAYWAFLTGRKAIYCGRNGEQHTEELPAITRQV